MTEEALTQDQFRDAASCAVQNILNLYGEVDALLRMLSQTLDKEEYRAWHLRPQSTKAAHNKILREWQGRGYVRSDSEGDDLEFDADEDDSKPGKRRELERGGSLAFAKVEIYRDDGSLLEPRLLYGVLTNASIVKPESVDSLVFKIKSSEFSEILNGIKHPMPARSDLRTSAAVLGTKGTKSNRRLIFDVPYGVSERPLYEIGTREVVVDIANEIHKHFSDAARGE